MIMIKEKGYPPLDICLRAWFTYSLDKINIICPHMEYEVVEKDEGTMNESSWGEICEERNN